MQRSNYNKLDNNLQFILKMPIYSEMLILTILTLYENSESHQYKDYKQYLIYQSKLYAWLIQAYEQNNKINLNENLAKRVKSFSWIQNQGINNNGGSEKKYRTDKITHIEHYQHILNYIKDNDIQKVVKIQSIEKVKNKSGKLNITQQYGLGIKPQGSEYTKYNAYFKGMSENCQVKFMRQSIKSVIALNKNRIDHNDITFRNYIYSFRDMQFKLIDFDTSMIFDENFNKNTSIDFLNSQTCISSLQTSFTKSGKEHSLIYIDKQIMQLKSNFKQFRLKNIGKKDAFMYGFMILRLLYNTNGNVCIDITKQIGNFVKMFQLGQFKQKYDLNNWLLENKIFDHKHFGIVKLILYNIMVQYSEMRATLQQLQSKLQWVKQLDKILKYQSNLTKATSKGNKQVQNTQQNQFGQSNTQLFLQFQNLQSIQSKQIDSNKAQQHNKEKIQAQKQQNKITQSKKKQQKQAQTQQIKIQTQTQKQNKIGEVEVADQFFCVKMKKQQLLKSKASQKQQLTIKIEKKQTLNKQQKQSSEKRLNNLSKIKSSQEEQISKQEEKYYVHQLKHQIKHQTQMAQLKHETQMTQLNCSIDSVVKNKIIMNASFEFCRLGKTRSNKS